MSKHLDFFDDAETCSPSITMTMKGQISYGNIINIEYHKTLNLQLVIFAKFSKMIFSYEIQCFSSTYYFNQYEYIVRC